MAGADTPPRVLPWIDGKAVDVETFTPLREPWHGQVVADVGVPDAAIHERALASSAATRSAMASMPTHERARLLRAAADEVERRAEEFAEVITRSTGKVITHTLRESSRAPWTLRLSASAAENLTAVVPPADAMPAPAGTQVLVRRLPYGTVLAITPFNAPLNLVLHKVGPALAAGNCVLVKPAPQVPQPALMLAQILTEVGFPPGAVNVVAGGNDTGAAFVADERVDYITFTGGTGAGAAIKAASGLRPVALELGGNSANIVAADADLDLAVRECVTGGFSNNGQSCNSVQRIFVAASSFEPFVEALSRRVEQLPVGDPMDPATIIGPLVNEASAIRVEGAVEQAVSSGAVLRTGGGRHGAVVEPTVLTDVDGGLSLYCDEVFAPVVMVEPFTTVDEAIAKANNTSFGLQAAVFTGSLAVAMRCFEGVRAGSVIVNRSSNFRLDQLPYGGIGSSGIGREGPLYAAEEMTYLKSAVLVPESAT
jgi:acyl-CoA reductase-like NAD-dependent aldehyde dehydrogenase